MVLVPWLLSTVSLLTFWLVLPMLLPPIAFAMALKGLKQTPEKTLRYKLAMAYSAAVLLLEIGLFATGYQP